MRSIFLLAAFSLVFMYGASPAFAVDRDSPCPVSRIALPGEDPPVNGHPEPSMEDDAKDDSHASPLPTIAMAEGSARSSPPAAERIFLPPGGFISSDYRARIVRPPNS